MWGATAKRLCDVVGAALLLVILAPLFALLAVTVKLADRGGPVFYRQTRVGRWGTPIRITKFRTMHWRYSTGPERPFQSAEHAFTAMGRPDLCAEYVVARKVIEDPRITRLGRFLRRMSLDELPQLVAVLRGELSLVGPRPILFGELPMYGARIGTFLAVRPGITGLWQVSGRSDVSWDEHVNLDVRYAENWSLLLDLSILVRTLPAVLSRTGAY
jgi:lipopolysaccharide/colanic/teichoic acid biosynthesis glycosyltransferase